MKTILIDIDGTIFKHHGTLSNVLIDEKQRIMGGGESSIANLTHGVLEKFNLWAEQGYTIVLLTGRTESMRQFTERQLQGAGIFYDHLIMGLPFGERVLINDSDDVISKSTASAYSVQRNGGIANVNV